VSCLQLTVYGLEHIHDEFAGRCGAFQNILTTICRANEHSVRWYVQIVLHANNVRELPDTITAIKSLDPSGQSRVGYFPFNWQGRGRNACRARASEYALVPEKYRHPRLFAEKDAILKILGTPELSGKHASETMCQALVFQVDRDMGVICGGACDSGGISASLPELASEFTLGTLDEDGLMPMVDAYLQNPPHSIQLLDQITWGELAERYGDPKNDEIYYLNDLPENKWAAMYLLEELGAKSIEYWQISKENL
jgi:hypothetical protein